MKRADIILDCSFNTEDPKVSVIKTNAKSEEVAHIIEEYILSQIGAGNPDGKDFQQKNIYHIVLKLNLADDTFFVESDTNNHALTVGIMLTFLNLLLMEKTILIQ